MRIIAVVFALVALFALPAAASAHERRDVGKYQFVVGFSGEPALLGLPNGALVRVMDKATNQPVEGVDKTLKVGVAFGGGQPKEFALTPQANQPGAYTAPFIPTRAGAYVFTFTGTIGEQTVNERFESGPGRFAEVATGQEMQFPETLPTTRDLQQQVQAADARAAQATTFGYVGTALGVVGIVLAALSLLRRPAVRVAA